MPCLCLNIVLFYYLSPELGNKSKDFKQLLLDTALSGIEQNFKVSLDKVNVKFPNIQFKGSVHPTILRRKSDNPPANANHENDDGDCELVQKSYCNQSGPNKTEHDKDNSISNGVHEVEQHSSIHDQGSLHNVKESKVTSGDGHNLSENCDALKTPLNFPYPPLKENKPPIVTNLNTNGALNEEYATPNYIIKEYNELSLDNYRNDKFCKSNVTIPSKLIVEIKLPLLKTIEFMKLNIQGKQFEFISEKPSKYKLKIKLPYTVDDDNGNAKFEVDKKRLVVTLPVVYKSEKDKLEHDVKHNQNSANESYTTDNTESVDSSQTNTESTHQNSTENASSALENGTNDVAISETSTNCSTNITTQTESTNEIRPSTKNNEVECQVQNESSTNSLEMSGIRVPNAIKENHKADASLCESEDNHTTSLKTKVLIEEIKESTTNEFHNEKVISNENGVEINEKFREISGDGKSIGENVSSGVKKEVNREKNKTLDKKLEEFFNRKMFYTFPEHIVNASGAQLVFVFNVNNVEKETVKHVLLDETTVLLQVITSLYQLVFPEYEQNSPS